MKKKATENVERNRIGERLRVIREQGNAKQTEYATLFGVTVNTIGRYERGERTPDAEFIVALCRETGVNPRWLLFGEEPISDKDRAVALEVTPGMKGKDLHGRKPGEIRGGSAFDVATASLQAVMTDAGADEMPALKARIQRLEGELAEARAEALRAKEVAKAKDETVNAYKLAVAAMRPSGEGSPA